MPDVFTMLSARLQDVTESLASAQTEQAVFDVILHPAAQALNAHAATVLLTTGAHPQLHRVATVGEDEFLPSVWADALVDDDGPAADALGRHTPLLFEHDGDLARAYPTLEARTGATAPVAATAVLPMFLDERPLGVLVLDFTEPHVFTDEERRFLRILAAQCAIAIGRARLLRGLEAQVVARTTAERAERSRADTLAVLGDALLSAATPEEVARVTLAQLGPALDARGLVMVQLDGTQAHAPVWWGEVPSPLRSLLTPEGLPLSRLPLVAHVQACGAGCYLPDDAASLPAMRRLTRDAVGVEHVTLPDGTLAGLLMMWRAPEHRPWLPEERALLRRGAATLGLALDRAGTLATLRASEVAVRGQNTTLEAQSRALHAANAELDAFALSVSHDLRTPVRHMIGFLALLRRALGNGLDGNPQAARYLGVVEEAAARMNTLIDALLDLARTSRQALRLERVNLGALVEAVRTELAAETEVRKVTWVVGALPDVQADGELLRQVMLNLLSNAVKYTCGTPQARIEVTAEVRAEEWVVQARDNGAGFDPAHAGRLFGVFQRLHRQEEFEGTGVGLANVRRIVERHGGRVWAEGQPGEGAVFAFTLPRPQEEATEGPAVTALV
ncbi:sensor histidine kinase [Deinococcus apachensis]|uniref:sensor histidine kinase n=1 Tax=Deinococcus apachensis TaxID=309886 RepID=UPI0012F76F10|nr:ATP-binding protein [Deinococcus apachensis]